ncbi:MAG TPA: hypothetical protein VH207_10715 [Chthoniobacterales bacterium]|nr:hypothetical protein [Chthoniobacterales bacterium]
MATDSTNPTWIEPPPLKRKGVGCVAKGCLALIVVVLVLIGCLFFVGRSFTRSQPKPLPVEELPPQALENVEERVDRFEAAPAAEPTPAPPGETAPAPTPERELKVSAAEINGLIANNKNSRGHAYVTLSGNTARVQISIDSEKVPGFPKGYWNGTFTITTDGPTPIRELRVSKIRANGIPMPASVLSMQYRGQSLLGIALDAISPYNVSTAEIRDGTLIVH